MRDARSSQFHDFDQVDLFPLGSLPRVLSDKGSLVEHELAGAIPPQQVVRPTLSALTKKVRSSSWPWSTPLV
jgi:hypothetical protein